MPPGTFAFNKAKAEFLRCRDDILSGYNGELFPWDNPDGPILSYHMLFVCNGGATNGLDAVGAEDALTLNDAPLAVMANLFDGAGYSSSGMLVESRISEIQFGAPHLAIAHARKIVIQNLFAGSVGHANITDMVLYWKRNLTVSQGFPLFRYYLGGSTYGGGVGGQGIRFEVDFHANGVFNVA
jgi:hypothetical protein